MKNDAEKHQKKQTKKIKKKIFIEIYNIDLINLIINAIALN